jgi:hypothetical protein
VSKDTEWFGAFAHRQTENAMEMHKTSRQHPEIGSVVPRMLWIPAVAAMVIAGYFALRMPQQEVASAMAVAGATGLATQGFRATPDATTSRAVTATRDLPDESIVRQQTLDPVGAGHDVAR